MDIKVKDSHGNQAEVTMDTSAWLVTAEEMAEVKQIVLEQLKPAFEKIFDSRNVSVKVVG